MHSGGMTALNVDWHVNGSITVVCQYIQLSNGQSYDELHVLSYALIWYWLDVIEYIVKRYCRERTDVMTMPEAQLIKLQTIFQHFSLTSREKRTARTIIMDMYVYSTGIYIYGLLCSLSQKDGGKFFHELIIGEDIAMWVPIIHRLWRKP